MIRAVLVLVCVALVMGALLAMRLGWRRRLDRQSHLPAVPTPPADLGDELQRASGVYVGTTFASSWQDRVLHDGLGERAVTDLVLYASGVLVERVGSAAIFIPASDLVEARLAPGLAGKVVGEGGLLVVRWRLGDTEVDTGFRADHKSTYPQIVQAINRGVPA
jgi:hypothetical protein